MSDKYGMLQQQKTEKIGKIPQSKVLFHFLDWPAQ